MGTKSISMFATVWAMSLIGFAAQAKLSVCTREIPQWQTNTDGKPEYVGKGPAVIINPEMKRVIWIGTGAHIRLTGEQTAEGTKIIRIDGRPGVEKILSINSLGQITDYQLEDSLGGTGLLRVRMTSKTSGNANWEHATDSAMRETLQYCTTNVLE